MASNIKVELCDVLTEHGSTRDELNIPCPADACNLIASKLDRWELLASFLGLAEEDCTAIREDYKTNYGLQRSISLTRWRKQLGSKATYLMLAEGLEKIKRFDLVGELCVLYKDTATQVAKDVPKKSKGPKGNLDGVINAFKRRFRNLVISIQKELNKQGDTISLEELLTDLTLLPPTIRQSHMTFILENMTRLGKASNLQEIFILLNLYWDYFNYTLLDVLIQVYGSDNLKKEMHHYAYDVQLFWKETTVADFIPYCEELRKLATIPEEFTQVKVKQAIEKPISEYTLMELEELKCRLYLSCQLPNFALILYDLKPGCVEVTWLVATELIKKLKKMLTKELISLLEKETHSIFSITLGDECIKEMTSSEKEDYIEEVWECEFQGEEYYGAVGPRDVLIISNETAEGPDVVQRKKGCLTQEDKDRLTSQGIPPDCWDDDVKMMEARYSKEKRFSVVSIERDTTAEHILSTIDTLLKNTKKPGVRIHYIGPGRRNTGDWCFKDGFITFNNIITLYEKYFKGKRALTIYPDCSYSGQWVKQGMEYLDKCKVQPCGHSARAAKIILSIRASCRSHQIPHTLLYSARGQGNDKNNRAVTYRLEFEICSDQHTRSFNSSTITCKKGATFEDPCSLPHDYTWHKKSEEKRVRLVSGKVAHGKQAWHYVLLVDDEEMIDMFNAKNSDIIDVADYGQILKSGWGQEPPDEVREWIKKKYPYY